MKHQLDATLCRNETCTVLHQVGVSFDLYYDARKHKIKIRTSFYKQLTRASNINYVTCTGGLHSDLTPVSAKSDVWLTVHRNSVWIRKTN